MTVDGNYLPMRPSFTGFASDMVYCTLPQSGTGHAKTSSRYVH